jgi:hypothetical protein
MFNTLARQCALVSKPMLQLQFRICEWSTILLANALICHACPRLWETRKTSANLTVAFVEISTRIPPKNQIYRQLIICVWKQKESSSWNAFLDYIIIRHRLISNFEYKSVFSARYITVDKDKRQQILYVADLLSFVQLITRFTFDQSKIKTVLLFNFWTRLHVIYWSHTYGHAAQTAM